VAHAVIPYDQENPPEQPPDGADPLVWQLAYLLYREHQVDDLGLCRARTCRDGWTTHPCRPAHLAAAAMVTATGSRAQQHVPWDTRL
jgi:hypothetical protein